ncbi:hypothetical protein DIS12_04680 [Leuconostoc citreum]|uniref:hypothetical protein n=1 Tax=Leuconostoc citreum TaxID=33964 RepID=UPI001120BB44|nr:hypothetical protein [Leuconostoc citreum]TOY70753.1 hypothetical protein DIS12_04680 [Leuconostoc citreum]
MSFELRGLNEFEKKITNLTDKVESLQGNHEIVITDDFVQSHSQFQSMSELLSEGGFSSIEEADDKEFDRFISDKTDFSSWSEFQENLAQDFFNQQLGL